MIIQKKQRGKNRVREKYIVYTDNINNIYKTITFQTQLIKRPKQSVNSSNKQKCN